jgi:hypothetical protein
MLYKVTQTSDYNNYGKLAHFSVSCCWFPMQERIAFVRQAWIMLHFFR